MVVYCGPAALSWRLMPRATLILALYRPCHSYPRVTYPETRACHLVTSPPVLPLTLGPVQRRGAAGPAITYTRAQAHDASSSLTQMPHHCKTHACHRSGREEQKETHDGEVWRGVWRTGAAHLIAKTAMSVPNIEEGMQGKWRGATSLPVLWSRRSDTCSENWVVCQCVALMLCLFARLEMFLLCL